MAFTVTPSNVNLSIELTGRHPLQDSFPVAANVNIRGREMFALNAAGEAVPPGAAAVGKCLYIAMGAGANNTAGAAGAKFVRGEARTAVLTNSAAAPLPATIYPGTEVFAESGGVVRVDDDGGAAPSAGVFTSWTDGATPRPTVRVQPD